MSDNPKPCRYVLHSRDLDEILCTHPLGRHWCPEGLSLGMPILDTTCHGCPCHEPQGLVFRSAEEVFKHYGVTLTDDGHEPFDPDPTPTGGKTVHDQP